MRIIKKLLLDLLIVSFSVGLFDVIRKLFMVGASETSLVILGIVICGVAFMLHGIFYYMYGNSKENTLADQVNSILKSNDEQLSEYLKRLESLKNSNENFADVISDFVGKVQAFSRKEEALKELIALNGDKYKSFLNEQSKSAQAFLVANLKKLVKSIIAYDAKSRRNRPENIRDEQSIQQVLTSVNELTDRYDDLLEEVKLLGDDFNLEAPGIKYAIENLQELRVGSDDMLDDEL